MAINERVYVVYFFGDSPEATDDWNEHYAETWQGIADNNLRQCSDEVNRVDIYRVPVQLENTPGYDLDLDQLDYRTSAVREDK